MASGLPWALACTALASAWTIAAAARAPGRGAGWRARALVGGLLSLAVARGAYALSAAAGADFTWEAIGERGAAGFGTALLAGALEESAKLAGIVVALAGRTGRDLMRATLVVAAVFAIGEAFVTMEGGSWALALARAALAPVAHAALAVPLAWALAARAGSTALRPNLTPVPLRLVGGLAAAAFLHGTGDWSLAVGGWGGAGFALATALPVVGLYVSRRGVPEAAAVRSVHRSVRSSSATPHACAMHPRGV